MPKTVRYVIIGAIAGALLGWLHTRGSFPGALEIGNTIQKPQVWLLIVGYFLLGYIILWVFVEPNSEKSVAAFLGAGFLWNAF